MTKRYNFSRYEDMQKRLEKIKEKAEDNYKQINKVFCPFLKRKVHFNTKGLDHIKFKGWNKTRLAHDQYLRLKFLHLAPAILEKSGTLQEYKETPNLERMKINSRWEKRMVPVKYYGFVAILRYEIRVKVIIKEVSGGQPYFWSIIPYWKTARDPILETTKKVFHEGDLEID
jgi:hypothetical protein